MKISFISLLIGASAVSGAAIEKRDRCTAIWFGSNSEGGGGPGQTPINNNAFGLQITGAGKKYGTQLKQNGPNGAFNKGVTAKQYHGDHNLNAHAQWNFGGNKWYNCHIMKDGKKHEGEVHKSTINSGIVSVTKDKCVAHFPC